MLGSDDARVRITGYFDLEAPESRSAWEEVSRLRGQYGDRIALEFRHYPITATHRRAMDAALAAEAAGEQEKFWEFLEILWNQQDTWRSISDPLPLFLQYAKDVGVAELSQFRTDLDRQYFKDRVLDDLRMAQQTAIAVDTPLVVNGHPVSTQGVRLAVERILSKPMTND